MILRCHAPPRNATNRKCDGFVARVPEGSRFVRLLAHSDLITSEDNTVAPCRACGFLHEIAPPERVMRALRIAA